MVLRREINKLILLYACILFFTSCKKINTNEGASGLPISCNPPTFYYSTTNTAEPSLIFKFEFDTTQVRLNNYGVVNNAISSGNAAQSPKLISVSQNYIELANDNDMLGQGEVLFRGNETNQGGYNAIDYCSTITTVNGTIFYSIPFSKIKPGTYKWLRISIAYQKFNVVYKSKLISGNNVGLASLASFIGYNTYLKTVKINGVAYQPSAVMGKKGNYIQGYWAMETEINSHKYFTDGQSIAITTVPNPMHKSSPVPKGSSIVSGQFVNNHMENSPLSITGNELKDSIITVSLSMNKSFEWKEVIADGYFQPDAGELVVDMGVRGLIPILDKLKAHRH